MHSGEIGKIMSSPDFDDAENFRDFSNVLADQVKEMEALAYMIPPDEKYGSYRDRLFAVAAEASKIHGGLLAVTYPANH
jgi:hypothetical protein